ncbi:hypothetical protein ISS85_02145 [Candidatus Microgenomates bacterium]|nr:hypothetical protein [Candidatus Microgenomates bacterium]
MKNKKLMTIFLIVVSIFLSSMTVFAQEEVPEASSSQKIEYTLPYPGILPDHPLYFLKAFRDKILDVLVQDPIKRIELNLLMADKRLNMGACLIEKGKPVLAETTVSKGEKYFLKIIEELQEIEEQNRGMDQNLLKKIEESSLKHEEIILELLEKAPDEQKIGLNNSLELIKNIQEKLD